MSSSTGAKPTAVYETPDAYPVLRDILGHFATIRAEALAAIGQAELTAITDYRVVPAGSWTALPLLPEPEDRPVLPGWEQTRRWTPRICALLDAEPAIKGYSLSCLRAAGHVLSHRHENPFVTAILTLQAAPGCYMVADGERRDFRTAALDIFDYRRLHEAHNDTPVDWISLLLLLTPA